MKIKRALIAFLLIVVFIDCQGQSCEIFEISNVNVYLYPISTGKNISKLNDSLSYSIKKLNSETYLVQELLFNKLISEHVYHYNGEKRYQIFKSRVRKLGKVKSVQISKMVCLLKY